MQGLTLVLWLFLIPAPLAAATIMTVSFDADEMRLVKETIAQDLPKHKFVDLIIKKDSEYGDFIEALKKNKPDFVALLDNKAVNFMKKLEEQNEKPFATLQAAATMALNLRHVLQGSQRICGIVYEVPAFTIVTKFRSLSSKPISTVVAPYRASEFEPMLAEARQQLAKEGITLIGVNVEADGKDTAAVNRIVEKALAETYAGKKVDAILVPSDNVILNKEAFASHWLQKARSLNIPFLCNIAKFTSKDFDFCTYAAYPDLVALGHQFAEQINEALVSGGSAADLGVDYIIAVQETINVNRARAMGLPLKAERLEAIHREE